MLTQLKLADVSVPLTGMALGTMSFGDTVAPDQARAMIEAGMKIVELAVRWLISKPLTGAVLLGGSSVDHLRTNAPAVAAGPLPNDVIAARDKGTAALRGAMPAYNR